MTAEYIALGVFVILAVLAIAYKLKEKKTEEKVNPRSASTMMPPSSKTFEQRQKTYVAAPHMPRRKSTSNSRRSRSESSMMHRDDHVYNPCQGLGERMGAASLNNYADDVGYSQPTQSEASVPSRNESYTPYSPGSYDYSSSSSSSSDSSSSSSDSSSSSFGD